MVEYTAGALVWEQVSIIGARPTDTLSGVPSRVAGHGDVVFRRGQRDDAGMGRGDV